MTARAAQPISIEGPPTWPADDAAKVDRFDWERELMASELTPTQRLVGLVLATHANPAGVMFVGITTLCAETGLGPTAARRARKDLAAAGWVRVIERGGRAGERRLAQRLKLVTPYLLPGHEVTGSRGDGDARRRAPRHEATRTPSPRDPQQPMEQPMEHQGPLCSICGQATVLHPDHDLMVCTNCDPAALTLSTTP